MKGYEVISALKRHLQNTDIVVSSNGNISREAFHMLPQPQVYLRGSMGLPISVGLGLAQAEPEKRIIVITGDGNFLMGQGSLTTAAFYKPNNLKVLILDNSSYYTTGGQETVSALIDYQSFLQSLNIKSAKTKIAEAKNVDIYLKKWLNNEHFGVLHLEIEAGSKDLDNIPWHPKEIKTRVSKKLNLNTNLT